MFDQLKQLAQLKKIKDSLEKEKKEIEREGIRVVVNGKMAVEEIKLNPQMEIERQGEIVRQLINDAFLQIQQEVAKKMFSGKSDL